MSLHPQLQAITERVIRRSALARRLSGRDRRLLREGPFRSRLSCGNLAHGFAPVAAPTRAACGGGDTEPGIITAYNDMLSAHQPFETYPEQIRQIARELGATAQVAGGVPAMCERHPGPWWHGAVAVLARCDRAATAIGPATTCSIPPSTSVSATRSCRGC